MHLKKTKLLVLIFIIAHVLTHAQMIEGQDTLYGNEWLQSDQTYIKFKITHDGLYKIKYADISKYFTAPFKGSQLQLWRMGKEIPLFITNNDTWTPSDEIQFYGYKNRSELDKFLFQNPSAEMLNPEYSLWSDTATYFLSVANTNKINKRISRRASNGSLANLPFFSVDHLIEFHDYPIDKRYDSGNEITYSSYDVCEGFGNRPTREFTLTLSPKDAYQNNAEHGILHLRLAGMNLSHRLEFYINNQLTKVDSFFGYQLKTYSIDIANNLLQNNIQLTIKGTAQGNDQFSVSTIHLVYPKKISGQLLENEKIFTAVSGLIHTKELDQQYIFLLNDSVWTTAISAGSTPYIEVGKSTNTLIDRNSISEITQFIPFENKSILSSTADYILISHTSLLSITNDYATYRASTPGGRFKSAVINVQDIYDQFGYGMKNVLALRNFGQYIRKTNPNLKYILLIGRALNYRDRRLENNTIKNAHLDLIPTYGYPGADNLIFAPPGSNVPNILFGRIAANTIEQASNYLFKVKEYEAKLKTPTSNDDLYWRKEILHLAGGSPTDGFDQILDVLKSSIINTPFLPNVLTVKKTSSDPVQGGPSNIVINKINQGVSIHTYLGHGAVSATEIGLDDPEIFNNTNGKYPIAFSLGCNSGNIHTTGVSLSESFLFSKKGDIVYLSSSSIGTDVGYRIYGTFMYPNMGSKYIDQSISLQHNKALEDYDKVYKDPFSVSLIQQFAIHGDPAIQLNYYNAPDFTIDEKSFKTEPQNIFTDLDSFNLNFTLWNLGLKYNQPVKYRVDHILANGSVYTYNYMIVFDSSSKRISVKLPLPPQSEGSSTINIKIDPDNIVNELPQPFAESNNELKYNAIPGFILNVYSNDVTPAYPPDFGIVANNNIELKAFTSNAFRKPTPYIFEIDTTELFNSPLKQRATVVQRGGLITWKPSIKAQNETVYYWRVASDTTGTTTPFIWKPRSFVHVPGKGPGWNQSHAFQFNKNAENQSLFYDIISKSWKLRNEMASIVVSSINHALDPAEYSKVLVNGGRSSRNNRTTNAEFIIAIWDTTEGRLLLNPIEGRDGAINAFGREVGVFTFPMDKNTLAERANMIRFLETGIKKGQYVIVYNHIEPNKSYFPNEWETDSTQLGKTLYGVLEKKGSTISRNLKNYNSYPYVFIYQEGGRVIDEQISTDGLQVRSAFELPLVTTQGAQQANIIGPATEWDRLEWSVTDRRGAQNTVLVIGESINRSDTLLITQDTMVSLRQIDPVKYPRIKLIWKATDTLKSQSIDLAKWRIYYTGYGDLAIQANENFSITGDTIPEFEKMNIKYGVQNIGTRPIDSFMVIQSYIDQSLNRTADTSYFSKLDPTHFKIKESSFSTEAKENNQSIVIDVVSLDKLPEVTLKNNSGKIDFSVSKDRVPPVIEILFDGKQILNNDLVSRQPKINISIKDNKEFSTTDSLQYSLQIKFPSKNQFEKINKNLYTLSYNTKEINIIYSPLFSEPGIYTLSIQGQDRSGNIVNKNPFEINFKVITENAVSSFFPYPNPFTSTCQFAYTLTGARPDIFKIQIMTVSGKLVRELTEFDLGPLKEGTHLTERSWDGTDEYGHKLATGTYLYRVITKTKEGKSYKEYESIEGSTGSIDSKRFFTNGIGKLVILR